MPALACGAVSVQLAQDSRETRFNARIETLNLESESLGAERLGFFAGAGVSALGDLRAQVQERSDSSSISEARRRRMTRAIWSGAKAHFRSLLLHALLQLRRSGLPSNEMHRKAKIQELNSCVEQRRAGKAPDAHVEISPRGRLLACRQRPKQAHTSRATASETRRHLIHRSTKEVGPGAGQLLRFGDARGQRIQRHDW